MSDETQPNEDSKIIVDDDWKSQVEKERAAQEPSGDADPVPDPMDQLPPASFVFLLSTLATQAMASLGFIPDPVSGQPEINRPMAKHFIDTLAMLQEKTKGNLDEDENAHLRDALHQLRMAYVASENNASTESTPSEKPPAKEQPPIIELP